MNRKQIMISTLLILLIVVLVLVQGAFNNKFCGILLQNNNMGQYKDYNIQGTHYKLSIPEKWVVNNSDNNLFCQIEMEDFENDIIGYVQIINTRVSIETLANNHSKNISLPSEKIELNDFCGKRWKGTQICYITNINKGYSYNNKVYYIYLENDNIGKVTFLTKQCKYKDNMKIIFDDIVDSIKYTDNKNLPLNR